MGYVLCAKREFGVRKSRNTVALDNKKVTKIGSRSECEYTVHTKELSQKAVYM